MNEYLFEASVWSVGGLFLGYVLGKIERLVIKTHEKVDHDQTR